MQTQLTPMKAAHHVPRYSTRPERTLSCLKSYLNWESFAEKPIAI